MARAFNQKGIFFIVLFFIATIIYLIFFQFWKCLGSERTLTIQKITEHGLVLINSISYKVPYKVEATIISVHTDNLIDYLFLSNSRYDESLLSSLIKIGMCFTVISTLLSFFIENKRVMLFSKINKLMPYLVILFIGVEFFQYIVSASWVSDPNHKLLGYEYSSYWKHVSGLVVPFLALAVWLRIQSIQTS